MAQISVLVIALFVIISLTQSTIATSETVATIGTRIYGLKSITMQPKANGSDQKATVEMVAPSDAEFPYHSKNDVVIKDSINEDTANYLLKFNRAVGLIAIGVESPSQSSNFYASINTTNPGINQEGMTVLNRLSCQYNVVKLSEGSKVRYEVVDKCGRWPGPGFEKEVYLTATVRTPEEKVFLDTINDSNGRFQKYLGKYEGTPSIQNPGAVSLFVDFDKLKENGSTLKKMALGVNVLSNNVGANIYIGFFFSRKIY